MAYRRSRSMGDSLLNFACPAGQQVVTDALGNPTCVAIPGATATVSSSFISGVSNETLLIIASTAIVGLLMSRKK